MINKAKVINKNKTKISNLLTQPSKCTHKKNKIAPKTTSIIFIRPEPEPYYLFLNKLFSDILFILK